MVTVRNDIELMAPAPDGTKVKDVNLKQDARPARRKSYRCITIVGVVTVVLLSLAVGSIYFFERTMREIPAENTDDGSPSSTTEPIQLTTAYQELVPLFTDPTDPMPDHDTIESEEEIDIDETPSNTLNIKPEVSIEDGDSIDRGSSGRSSSEEDEREDEDSSGSGASGDMW